MLNKSIQRKIEIKYWIETKNWKRIFDKNNFTEKTEIIKENFSQKCFFIIKKNSPFIFVKTSYHIFELLILYYIYKL